MHAEQKGIHLHILLDYPQARIVVREGHRQAGIDIIKAVMSLTLQIAIRIGAVDGIVITGIGSYK
jgi:hypothetical protein